MVWNLRYWGGWDESVFAILLGGFGVKNCPKYERIGYRFASPSVLQVFALGCQNTIKKLVQKYLERFK